MARKPYKLTSAEREVLEFLWDYGSPLTSARIVELCTDRHWKDSYIHLIIQSLLKKEAITIVGFIPSGKNYARTFSPTMTREEFVLEEILREYPEGEEMIPGLIGHLLDRVSDSRILEEIIEKCSARKKVCNRTGDNTEKKDI